MKIEDLQTKLDGTVEGYTPIIGIGLLESGDEMEKLMMMKNGELTQVFGVTQNVLDIIELSEKELVKFIVAWTKACRDSSEQTIIEEGNE